MRRVLLVGALFVLSACARDNYTVISNGPGSQERMAADLKSCKLAVLHQYAQQSHIVLGGAVGGVIGGALNSSNNTMTPADIDPAIEQCMREKGYVGTSEN